MAARSNFQQTRAAGPLETSSPLTGFLTVGPTLAQRRQATGENYILCIASANQMMFIDNFCSLNF